MHKPRIQALKLSGTQLLLLPLHIAFPPPPPAPGDGKAKGQADEEGASVAGSSKQWIFYQLKEVNGNQSAAYRGPWCFNCKPCSAHGYFWKKLLKACL